MSSIEKEECISPILFVPKPDSSSYWLFLNFTFWNDIMPYIHFKMEIISSISNLKTPNCFIVISSPAYLIVFIIDQKSL